MLNPERESAETRGPTTWRGDARLCAAPRGPRRWHLPLSGEVREDSQRGRHLKVKDEELTVCRNLGAGSGEKPSRQRESPLQGCVGERQRHRDRGTERDTETVGQRDGECGELRREREAVTSVWKKERDARAGEGQGKRKRGSLGSPGLGTEPPSWEARCTELNTGNRGSPRKQTGSPVSRPG